jgi:hypothetical protein
MKNLATILVAATLLCGLVGVASAASVSYTVNGLAAQSFPGPIAPPSTASHVLDGLGYPGDSVALQAYTGTLDLTPGTSIQKINTLQWNVSYTYAGAGDADNPDAGWTELSSSPAAIRGISIDGATQTLAQTGLLEVNWDNDYLSLSSGETVTLTIPGYEIDITPLGLEQTGASLFPGYPGGTPWLQPDQNVMAQFTVRATPEPATLSLLVLGGLAMLRRKRK